MTQGLCVGGIFASAEVYRLKVAEPKVADPMVAQTKGCQTKVAKPNCGPSALRGFLTGTTGT